ncbi:hypothetical protein [Terrisporobacter vanillatitrophus]|uniref:hypothetical protein n=1 Tax=Terrisporobacter vanillatitrophus TaxID=3058402 RepID=UPI003369BB4D
MKMYMKGSKRSKETGNSIPNTIAYAAIKNFLVSKEFAEKREEYCIGKLDKKQVSQIMTDIKWLFRNYKDLEVLAIEDSDNKSIRFTL